MISPREWEDGYTLLGQIKSAVSLDQCDPTTKALLDFTERIIADHKRLQDERDHFAEMNVKRESQIINLECKLDESTLTDPSKPE